MPARFGATTGSTSLEYFCLADFLWQVLSSCEDSFPVATASALFSDFGFGISPFRYILGIVVALCSGLVFSLFLFWVSSMANLRSCGFLRLMVWSLCFGLCGASISEDTIAAISARNMALAGVATTNPLVIFHDDWRRVHRIHGLPLYLGVYVEHWEFYTPHGGSQPLAPDQTTLRLSPSTSVHTVCQFIHRTWRPSYFFEWEAGAVHSSVHSSEVLPRRNLHVLLHHRSEVPLRQSMAAVLVEVRWWTADWTKSMTALSYWIPRVVTIPIFLQHLGLLRACTTSHRCAIFHNDRLVDGMAFSSILGDFLVIEGFPLAIPPDSDEEAVHSPSPIHLIREATSSPTTSEDEDDPMDTSSTTSTDEDGPNYRDLTVLIYRPRGPPGRPTQIVEVLKANARHLDTPCLHSWPDLRPKPWAVFPIHPSYQLTFPQHEISKHFVIHDPIEAGPRFTLLLMISSANDVYIGAAMLTSPTSRLQILTAAGLNRLCPLHYRNCLTYVNEIVVTPLHSFPLFHGGFVRIDIAGLGNQVDAGALAQAFNIWDNDLGMAYFDENGVALFNRPSSNMVITSPNPNVVPGGGRDHAMYWIFMAWLCNFSLGFLLRNLLYSSAPTYVAGPSRKGLRHARKVRCLSRQRRKSLWLLYLTLWGQTESTAGLQLHQTVPGDDLQHYGELYGFYGGALVAPSSPLWVDAWAHLPPPGNTIPSLEDCKLQNWLTEAGSAMLEETAFWFGCLSMKKRLAMVAPTPEGSVVELVGGTPLLPIASPVSPVKRLCLAELIDHKVSSSTAFPVSPFHGNVESLPIAQDSFTPNAVTDTLHVDNNCTLVGDPDTERPCIDVRRFDQDLDDLFTPWCSNPVAFPENDFEDAFVELVTGPTADEATFDEIYIFTDGSHGDSIGELRTSWAFCVIGFATGRPHLIDWYGDFITTDPLDPMWIGAIDDTIRGGEASALVYAALWILQRKSAGPPHILSDSLTSLNSALGKFGYGAEDPLMLRLRALYLFVQQFCSAMSLRHVKAHSGVLGNEFADRLAVKIREGSLPSRPSPRNFALWFHGNPPRIFQAGFIFDFSVRPQSLPRFDGHFLHLDPPDIPSAPPMWLREEQAGSYGDFTPACLQCCTYNVNTLKHKGMVSFLRDQFSGKHIFLAGLQETRSKSSTTFDTDYVRLVAPAEAGNGGTELWISTTIPFGWSAGRALRFSRDSAQVLHCAAEILVAVLDFQAVKLLCVVAHGPHRGHASAHIEEWWQHFQSLCYKHRHIGPIVVFIDANAGVGLSPPHFGNAMSQSWDTAGSCMLAFCQALHLYAPSTFDEIHSGESTTWHSHKVSRPGSRNDYILCSLGLAEHFGTTWIDRFIDSGHARLDHSAVVATIWCPFKRTKPKCPKLAFDRQRILEADDATWDKFFADWDPIDWKLDVDSHAAQLEHQIVTKLSEFFPAQSRKQRTSLFSDGTWTLYHQKAQLRQYLTSCSQIGDLWQLAIGFSALRGLPLRSPCLRLFGFCLRTCGRFRQFQFLSKTLRRNIMLDKAKAAEDFLEPLQQANGKQAIRLLKPLRLGKRHRDIGQRSLPIVRLKSGEVASTPEEALQRWREHFGEIEGGITTTPSALWTSATASRALHPPCHPQLSDIPTLLELEAQLRKIQSGKAPGPDLIPGEFLKSAGPRIARELWPLLFKICCHVQEPLLYKGGRLATLFKHKGSAAEAANHRAILISSTIGKAVHGVFRDRVVPYVRGGATELQFSAHRGALVSLGAHIVRLHQQWAKQVHLCDFTLFIDIASAYYSLLRQLAMDVEPTDENILTLLKRLGYPDGHIQAVAEKLEEPSAMEDLQVPPHLRAVLGEFHSSTWFRLKNDSSIVATARGTRPGDSLADILWTVSFSKFLHLSEERIASLGLHRPLRWNNEVGLCTALGEHTTSKACVTWADDLACIGTSPSPMTLIPQIQVIAEALFSELFAMGLRPNFQTGKTEVVVSLRGPQKVAVQQLLHGPQQSTIHLANLPDEASHLRVVPHYVHLGGLISHGGRLKGEIRRRFGIARQSFNDLAPKVFSNPKVNLATRLAIFKATVWLSLTYNIGTWSELSESEQHIWHSGVLRLYRLLLRRLYPAPVVRHFTEDEVMSLVGLPTPLNALRLCRLRHFAQVLTRGTPFFWALVAEEGSWLRAVQADFGWLYAQIDGLTTLPPPDQDPLAWHALIQHSIPRWKGLLKRVSTHSIMVDTVFADVRIFHRKLLDILFKAGLRNRFTQANAFEEEEDVPENHVCWICRKEFGSFKAWGSHSFKVHGRTNACRHLQEGSTCQACGKLYPSPERLVRHLRTHAPCRQTLAAQRGFFDAQPYYGSKEVQARTPIDSMKTWLPTSVPVAPRGDGWPMTSAMWSCLRILVGISWDTTSRQHIEDTFKQLSTFPIHRSEILHLLASMDNYYQSNPNALHTLASLAELVQEAFTPRGSPAPKPAKKPPTSWLNDLENLFYVNSQGPSRMPTRLLYVVHLFSGTKREGDLHSFVAQLPAPSLGVFCPISVDVVLDSSQCNLLSPRQQHQWLSMALRGFIYMLVAGPPCETWSVSRMRFLETRTGPRPLRSTASDDSLWCKAPLRLRELRQLVVGNGLLQFSLLMCAAQACMCNIALLEHPSASSTRYNQLPPSIWRLKATKLLLLHPGVQLHLVQQGFYGGSSPKPTTLMIICPLVLRYVVQKVIDDGRTCAVLPPPVKMGRLGTGYATAPLKRYPPGLCRMISQIALKVSECAQACDPLASDPLFPISNHLEEMYQTVLLDQEDGQDFFEGPQPN